MEETKASSDFLHFGQLISICLEDDSFIYSKGFIDNSVYLQQFDDNGTYDFSASVFRVLPQCMYSVQNDLLASSEELSQQHFSEKFSRHEESLEGEIKTNIQTFNNFKGEPIRFGSIVQLQHVLSYKFITLVPQENAEIEKENLRLRLTEFASECSYIRIEPGFKFQKESDGLVRINDRVVFEILLPDLTKSAYFNTNDFTAAIKSEMQEGELLRREVNASLDHKVRWKIKQYSKFISEKETSLLCGDYIWLTHSEEESCLVSTNRGEGSQVFFNSNMNDTNGLWKLEGENDKEGGFITSDRIFRLKHASTGLYLSLTQDESKLKGMDNFSRSIMNKIVSQSMYSMTLSTKKDPFSLWKFQPLLNNKKVRRINKDDFCVLINTETETVLHGIQDKKQEQGYSLIPFMKNDINEESYFKVFKCEDSLIWGTLFLLDCMPILTQFPAFVMKHSQIQVKAENLSFIREFKKHTELVQKCLENLSLFCKNTLKSMITVNKQYGHVEALRQKILREQLFIDALADILSSMFVGNFSLSKIMSALKSDNEILKEKSKESILLEEPGKKRQKDVQYEMSRSQIMIIVNIAKQIYQLLSVICKGNRENQNYSFKFFKVFQKHAAYGLGATHTMMTILDSNETLLLQLHKPQDLNTDRGNDSIIGHYSWLLRKFYRERKPQLIEFLRFICTYKGEGLSVNQEKIHEMLFGNPETHSKAVITTSTLSDKMTLYVFLQHHSGIGEENISLESCFINGEIDPRYLNEIQYFTRMLELFSDMCTGRNYICKASIKDWFPIQVLVSNIWNEQLSPDIRAAFLKLMLNMHVDSQPRQEIPKPELIRVLGLILKEDLKIVHKQKHSILNIDSGLDIAHKMHKRFTHFNRHSSLNDDTSDDYIIKFVEDEVILYELKENVIKYLQVEGLSPKFNVLTHQVLKMGRKLAKFEVLGVACSNTEEGFCILNPKHEKFNYDQMDLIRLLNVVKPLLLYGIELYEGSKKASSTTQVTIKKTQESFESLLTKLLHDANSLGDPVVRYADNLRNYLKSSLTKNILKTQSRSYEARSKIEICQLLHYVLDWRQDFLLSNVVMWFNTIYLDRQHTNINREVKNLFPPITHTQKPQAKGNFLNLNINLNINLNLNNLMKMKFELNKEPDPVFKAYVDPEIKDIGCLGDEIITQLLKMFCANEDYKMKSLLINLILRSFNQRTELLKNTKKLHVMTLIQDTEIFTWTKTSLFTFKQLSEQSELWLKYWMQSPFLMEKNIDKLENVQNILDKFSIIMFTDTLIEAGIPIPGEQKHFDKDRQMMCYHLSMHKYIIHLLRDGMYTLADIYDDPKSSKEMEGRNRLLKIFKGCYTVLTCMVKANNKVQRHLQKHLNIFTTFLRIPVGQIELICEIFRDNPILCSGIKDDFIKQFIDLIVSEGRQTRFLMVYEIIQNPCGTPIPEIQRLVLLNLLNANSANYICYMNKECTEFVFDPLENPPLFSPHYRDEPILYHSLLIKILKLCGQGASGVYLTEAKCQKILSIKHIFELLGKDDVRFSLLHLPLLGFFYHIYLDSEQKVEELENSREFIGFLSKQTEKFKKISVHNPIEKEYFETWVCIMHTYRMKYVEEIHSLKMHDDVYTFCDHLKVLTEKWHHFQSLNLHDEIYNKLEELGQIYNFEFPMPIEIEEFKVTAAKSTDTAHIKEKWLEFHEVFLYNKALKDMLHDEHKALYNLILDIEGIDDKLRPDIIFKTAIDFIKESSTYKPPLNVLVNVINFLSAIVSGVDKLKEAKDAKEGKEGKENHREKLQNDFCEHGAAKIALGLMCDRETQPEAFNSLLLFSIQLLEGGNQKAQQDFYQYFITMTVSSVLFERIASIITDYTEKNSAYDKHERVPIYKSSDLLITNVLKFLQLLCENHNQLLQNYLRFQTNSRSNFDMVALTIFLLEELMKRKSFYQFLIISQCFDTLTEFIQGPCRENQKAIIDSKFLEVASGLLSLDEKSDALEKYKFLIGESIKTPNKAERCLKGWMISHLKHKCMITIQSLLEGQIDNYVITRMIRALNIEIFKENLISFYLSYLNTYNKGYYDYDLFNHYERNDDYNFGEINPQDVEFNSSYYQFIIEVGFLIYHLMCCFKDNDDPENKAIIENELPELMPKEEASNFIATKLIGDLGKIGLDIFKSGFSVVSRLAGGRKAKVSFEKEDRKKILEEAYNFFQVNSGNVEVIFVDKKLFKVYFWIPPECHHLTKESKDVFHNNVERSSDKAKIQFLMQKAMEMIEEMQHEFRLTKFFNKYKVVSFFTSRVTVWKEIAFSTTLILNFFIIASYYENSSNSRVEPVLFYENYDKANYSNTQAALRIIGIIQCVCSILIVTFFIMKTAPVLIQRGWKKHQASSDHSHFPMNLVFKLKSLILTLYFTLSNIDVLYHLLYMIFSILGIAYNPLFFSLHLLDVLYRYPSLQNVIKSIVLPRKSLILTFILILILIYLFSIWAFLGFSEYFDGQCNTMIMCIKTTFDQGIKNGGGIGQFLDENDGPVSGAVSIILRFLFDDLFNIIIMIIMMNIIQGIIIDTFAVLREESERNTADRETKCFICGKDKEYIERCTNRPFRYHCAYEHNEWNYIYFIAYLKNKESTEHTGVESSIFDLVEAKDISWIPQQQGLTLKDIEDTEELHMMQKVETITQTYESLQKEMRDVKKYFMDYLESKQAMDG